MNRFLTRTISLSSLRVAAGLLLSSLVLMGCTQSFEEDQNAFEVEKDSSTVYIETSFWKDQCESCHRTADIPSTPSLTYWGSRSAQSLADYITATMPYTNPASCSGDCAVETARYMQAVIRGNTIVDSGINGSDNSDGTDNSLVEVEPSSNYAQQCESCHKSEKIVTEFASWKLQSAATLQNYIEMTMPFANAGACVGDCAAETANYILSVLDASDSNSGNQSGNGGDDGSDGSDNSDGSNGSEDPDPDQNQNTQTKPLQPTNISVQMSGENVQVTWNDNSDNEASFTIWRKAGGASWSAYQTVAANTTSFLDQAPVADLLQYRLSASNSVGTSNLSEIVSVDLTPEEAVGSCSAPQYSAGTAYSSGQLVQNLDRFFECKTGVAAWCSSSADWAYEPGKGLYWDSAWTEISQCNTGDETSDVVLNTPTLLSEDITETTASIRWLDNSEGETAYVIEKAVGSNAFAEIATLPANTEAYSDADNSYGTEVRYRIYAKTANEQSNKLSTSTLSIAQSAFDPAAYYATDCASCHGARGEGTSNGALQVSGFNDSDLTLSELVTSIDVTMPFGNATACQGECAQQVAEYIFAEFMTASEVPAAVSNVFVGANSDKTVINLSWSDNSDNEKGFKVDKKVNGGAFATFKTLAANTTSTTDNDVSVGSTYQYRITAYNDTETSTATVSAALLLEQSVTLPAKPTNLQVRMENGEAILSWTDNASNETNFVIQRRKNKGNWSADIVVGPNTTSYADDTVSYGNTYDYRILATNTAGDSQWSDEITLDITSSENRRAFDTHCAGCHKDGGLAVDLLNDYTKQNWASSDYDAFLSKVNTMPVNACDEDCKQKAATFVWAESWEYEMSQEIASTGRGVRGLRLLTSYEYINTVRDVFGFAIPDNRLPADRNSSHFKFATEAHAGVVVYDRLNEFLLLAEYVAENTSAASYGCSSTCTSAQLQTLLEKAFRRSIDSNMLNEYVTFQGQYGREDLIASILLSPWFLYRTELGEWNATAEAYQLTDYEVATSLSYQLWGTAPDATLLTKARSGQLSTAAQIETEATRLMNDAKAAQHLVEFVKYYTNTQANLAEKPNLPLATIEAMEKERDQAVIFALTQGNATLDELYNPGYTYVNNTLATHYGISGISSSAYSKVNTSRNRGGLLHQGILQVHNSDFSATSLVKRGKMIRENLMCHMMGVPSGVDPSAVELPQTPITTRERWDVITGPDASEGQCWTCHQLMNEPGSVLESFDAAGRFRSTEAAYNDPSVTLNIETQGSLRSNDATEILLSYNDARDLSQYLANNAVGQDCFVDNYVRFSTGYEVDNQFKSDVNQWQNAFRSEGDIWELVLNAVKAESFLYKLDRN